MFTDTLTIRRYPPFAGSTTPNFAGTPTTLVLSGCDAQPGASKSSIENLGVTESTRVDWTVFVPGGSDVRTTDHAVLNAGATLYTVVGEPERWGSGTGPLDHVVVYLTSTRYASTVSISTYLGSSGFGGSWATAVDWPANIVSIAEVSASSAGDESDVKVTVRVPASSGSAQAVAVFTPGSVLTVAGVVSTVATVQPITRDGVTEFVEVTAR